MQLPPRLTRGCSSKLLGGGQEQALLLAFFSTKKRVDSPLPFFWQLDLITRLGSNYCPIFNFSFSPFLYYNYIIFYQKKSTIFWNFFQLPIASSHGAQVPAPIQLQLGGTSWCYAPTSTMTWSFCQVETFWKNFLKRLAIRFVFWYNIYRK